jgi:hypothetical protein
MFLPDLRRNGQEVVRMRNEDLDSGCLAEPRGWGEAQENMVIRKKKEGKQQRDATRRDPERVSVYMA